MLMGEPSPALTKMRKMNAIELAAYAHSLVVENERIQKKIANLERVKPAPAERIADLTKQIERLAALSDMAKKRMEEIEQRTPRGRYEGRSFNR
jgi:hypothetical protein